MSRANNIKALEEFGKNLNRIRKKKNFSLRELSYACKIDHSKIGKIEKGLVNISVSTVVELARGLEVKPKVLFDFDID